MRTFVRATSSTPRSSPRSPSSVPSLTARGGELFEVTGDFTIRDVTRRITLPVSFLGKAADPWGNERIAFEAEYTLNRKDYGLNWNAALETGGFLVGDDVKITLSVQAVPVK